MKVKSAEELGALIRTERKHLKATQKDVAMACGTGLRFIVDLEKGKPTCEVGKVLRVLRNLGLSIDIARP
jgi:y4mF family transcriptional regulator